MKRQHTCFTSIWDIPRLHHSLFLLKENLSKYSKFAWRCKKDILVKITNYLLWRKYALGFKLQPPLTFGVTQKAGWSSGQCQMRQSENSNTPTGYRTAAIRFVAYHFADLTRLFLISTLFSIYVGFVNETNKHPQHPEKYEVWSTKNSAAEWKWLGYKTCRWGIIPVLPITPS